MKTPIQKGAPLSFGSIDLAKVRCNFGEILRIRSAVNEFVTVVVREEATIRVRHLMKLEDGTFIPSVHILEELHADDLLLNAIARAEKAEAENARLRAERAEAVALGNSIREAASEDKARLDWLQGEGCYWVEIQSEPHGATVFKGHPEMADLRAAIDAARKAAK